MEKWVRDILACPVDRLPLRSRGEELVCDNGHTYPVIQDIPVLLRPDVEPTHRAFHDTRYGVEHPDDLCIEPKDEPVDEFVQGVIAATGGYLYKALEYKLPRYPIPELRLAEGGGARFLELGCNWGRWCISAARKGYRVVGIDPSLYAVSAAQRVARQLHLSGSFIVSDARHLPFRSDSFEVVFSYSVLQHFAKSDVELALVETQRVLTGDGLCMVQLPNVYGVRNLYHQARRGFREGREFDVRYWTPRELRETFTRCVGATSLSVDGFFSLNAQASDANLMPPMHRTLVGLSERLRAVSRTAPWLQQVADSLYVSARKES